jgi:RNA polymerase sigma factor (TIGR02999 family)
MGHGEITKLLKAHAAGDSDALNDLFPLVYGELRRMAHRRMQQERAGHTFSTTALVHEAYLELVDLDRIDWQDRTHFFALAARVMRHVLVDYAVKRTAQKRGGDRDRVPLREGDAAVEVDLTDVLAVHQALTRLEDMDERQARVVECRFFGGLTIDETSEALDVSPATVGRDWRVARAWLNRELTTEEGGDTDEQPNGA